jgi:two-component system, OmpR family, sensor kinase
MESNRGPGLRTKVVIASVIVLALSTAISVGAVRQILLAQLRTDIERSLVKEVGEFHSVFQPGDADDQEPLDVEELSTVFDAYLAQNIPSEGEEVLAIVGDRPYASERAHDAGIPLDSLANHVVRWARLDVRESGTLSTPVGELIYIAEPVTTDGAAGALVIANSPEFERGEIDDVSQTMALVGIVVVIVGSLLSWVAAGRVVAPVHQLTRTARSISETDLSERITVRGSDEVALLAQTFNGMLDRLEQAFTLQRWFAQDAGHELRTPITIVRGHLELMGDDPRERSDTMRLVMSELERMDRIVNDLLLLAKAGQPGFVEPAPVDLAALTEEIHAKVTAIADRDWRLTEVGHGELLLDSQRVTQAMMQLASNAAWHAVGEGSIEIGSSSDRRTVRLWVRDHGPGIPHGAQERIFDRFMRGDASRHTDGAGLGLSVVKAIAEAHGGTVELESRPGAGATFTIAFPAIVSAARLDQREVPA